MRAAGLLASRPVGTDAGRAGDADDDAHAANGTVRVGEGPRVRDGITRRERVSSHAARECRAPWPCISAAARREHGSQRENRDESHAIPWHKPLTASVSL